MINEPADLRILAFGVFANHHQIDLLAAAQRQRRCHAFVEPGRPDICILSKVRRMGSSSPFRVM